MPPRDPEELECERFLQKFENWADPTWGFYVYGTYKRPEDQKETVGKDGNTTEPAGRT